MVVTKQKEEADGLLRVRLLVIGSDTIDRT